MKKLILAVVMALILFFIIGFNYLLWDRENKSEDIEALRYASDSSNNYINSLQTEIRSLEDEIKMLKANVDSLQAALEEKEKNLKTLSRQNEKLAESILVYEKDLQTLAGQVDADILGEIIIDWIDYVKRNNPWSAYNYFNRELKDSIPYIYFRTAVFDVETIDIISISEAEAEERLQEPGTTYISAILNIIRISKAVDINDVLGSGTVKLTFGMEFDPEFHSWCIKSYSREAVDIPPEHAGTEDNEASGSGE